MRLIVAQGNDYVISVKANQGRLYRWIRQQLETTLPHTQHQQRERGHGRTLVRRVSTFELSEALKAQWAGAQQVVCVETVLRFQVPKAK